MWSWRRRPKVLVPAPVFVRGRGHRELQGEIVDQGADQTAGGHRRTVRTTIFPSRPCDYTYVMIYCLPYLSLFAGDWSKIKSPKSSPKRSLNTNVCEECKYTHIILLVYNTVNAGFKNKSDAEQ